MAPCVVRAIAMSSAVALCVLTARAAARELANAPPQVDGKSASEWIKLLAHTDAGQRDQAHQALVQFDPPPVREILTSLPRRHVEIGKLVEPSPQDLDLAQSLNSVLEEVDDRAMPSLAELLNDKNDVLRARAAGFLGRFVMVGRDDGKHIPKYRKLLDDKSPLVRTAAVRVLGNLDDPSDEKPHIERLLKDPDVTVQLAAAVASTHIDQLAGASPRMPAIIRKSLSHEDEFIRMQALQGVVALGPLGAEALPDLDKLLRDKNQNPFIRIVAAAKHVALSDKSTGLPVIVESLAAASPVVRESAARILGDLGEKAATARGDLAKLAQGDPSRRVRDTAAQALETIGN